MSKVTAQDVAAAAGVSLATVDRVLNNRKGVRAETIDRVQAGPGDRVLVMSEGNGVRQLMGKGDILPIRSLVVGVVDEVELQ